MSKDRGSLKAWGGFVNGRLHRIRHGDEFGRRNYAIYTSEEMAKKAYQDVRKVIIKELKK